MKRTRPHIDILIMAALLAAIFLLSLGKNVPGEGLDGSQYGALVGIAVLLAAAFRKPKAV